MEKQTTGSHTCWLKAKLMNWDREKNTDLCSMNKISNFNKDL